MRARPDAVYLGTGFTQGFTSSWFLAAVVWWVVDLELDPIQLVLLGTVLELTVLIAEVPTGVLADLYSRKWSVIVSYALMGLAMVLGPITEQFALLLLWQVLWSVGWTFQSGADTAWVTDELARRGDDQDTADTHPGDRIDRLIVRHAAWRSVGLLVGLPFVSLLGVWSLRGSMLIVGLISIGVAVALAGAMSELGFERPASSDRSRWADAIGTWRTGATVVRQSRVLRLVILSMLLTGPADEIIDRLDVRRLTDLGLPDFADSQAVVFFGVIWWVMTLLNLPVMVWLSNRLDHANNRRAARMLQVLLIVAALGTLALALSPAVWFAVAGWTVRDVAREVLEPLSLGLTNRHAPGEVRATVISFRGQAEAVGEVVGGLALGSLAQLTTVPTALTAAAILLVLAAAPYLALERVDATPAQDA